MKNVLVTGARGFVGRHLVEKLTASGRRVVGVDLPEHDVADLGRLEQAVRGLEIDTVYHLAARMGTAELNSHNGAVDAVRTNVLGTINVLSIAKAWNARVVYLSKPDSGPNTYTITKVAAQRFCEMYRREFGMGVAVFVGFNLYGEGQEANKAVPRMIATALEGKPIEVYGDGSQAMDLIHVGDAVDALVAAGEHADCPGTPVDLGCGCPTAVKDLAHAVSQICARLLGTEEAPVVHLPPRSGEVHGTWTADPEALGQFYHVFPRSDHLETLRSTAVSYLDCPSRLIADVVPMLGVRALDTVRSIQTIMSKRLGSYAAARAWLAAARGQPSPLDLVRSGRYKEALTWAEEP